jgi:hypothetical protein
METEPLAVPQALLAASTVWPLNWSAQQDAVPVATRDRNDWFGTRYRPTNRRPCPRTPTPSLASMSIKASVLNKSMRPRRRSLTRGCVT